MNTCNMFPQFLNHAGRYSETPNQSSVFVLGRRVRCCPGGSLIKNDSRLAPQTPLGASTNCTLSANVVHAKTHIRERKTNLIPNTVQHHLTNMAFCWATVIFYSWHRQNGFTCLALPLIIYIYINIYIY